jgi:histidinol-phosphate aminotransferase
MRDVAAWAAPGIRGLASYDPGHDIVALRRKAGPAGLLELGGNESPWGASPLVRPALQAELDTLAFYPDPRGGDLKSALAEVFGLATAQVYLANGSHELLMQLAQVFAGPGRDVLVSRYCFAVYPLAAQAANARLRVVEALPANHPTQPRGHDVDALIAALDDAVGLVMLANPNNPTGTWLSLADIERLLAAAPAQCLVVLDEAYAEFLNADGAGSAAALLAHYPNLLITRTFSKIHGLAALRVGYALAQAEVLAVLERVRESFNVNALGLAAALAAVADQGHAAKVAQANAGCRERLAGHLRQRGLRVGPSQTNFLLVDFGSAERAAAVDAALLARDIVVRPMRGYGLPQCLRITVGSDEQNARLLEALDGALA